MRKLLTFLALPLALASCEYESLETKYPEAVATCDTAGMDWAKARQILEDNSCISCHGASSPSADVALDSYAQARFHLVEGRAMGAIRQLDGYSPMPQGQPPIDSCSIARLQAWIDQGAPEE